jgi:hypothetical protein
MATPPRLISQLRRRIEGAASKDDPLRTLVLMHVPPFSRGGQASIERKNAIHAEERNILAAYSAALEFLNAQLEYALPAFVPKIEPWAADLVSVARPFERVGGSQVRLLGKLTAFAEQVESTPTLLDHGVSHLVTLALDVKPLGWQREPLFPPDAGFPAVRLSTELKNVAAVFVDVLLDISLYHAHKHHIPQELRSAPDAFSRAKVEYAVARRGPSTFYGPIADDAPYVSFASLFRESPTLLARQLHAYLAFWKSFIGGIAAAETSVSPKTPSPLPPPTLAPAAPVASAARTSIRVLSLNGASRLAKYLVGPEVRRYLGRKIEKRLGSLDPGYYALLRIRRRPHAIATRATLRSAICGSPSRGSRARFKVGAMRVVPIQDLVRLDFLREYLEIVQFEIRG